MSRKSGGKKKRSTAGLILDVILVFATGGLWLIWILVRYLRNNSYAIKTKYRKYSRVV